MARRDKPDYSKMFSEMEAQMGSPYASSDPAGIPGDVISGNIMGEDNPITEDHGDHHHHADGTVHQNQGADQQGGGNFTVTKPFLVLQFDHEPTEEEDTVRIVGMNINGGNGMPESRDAFIDHLRAALDMLEGPNELNKKA